MRLRLALALCLSLLGGCANASTGKMITLHAARRSALERFVAEDKFQPDQSYAGFIPKSGRVAARQAIDGIVPELLAEHELTEDRFFEIALRHLDPLRMADTEDRERALGYVEQLMDVLGIESSGGRLNNWMYGPEIVKELDRKAKP